MPDPNSGLSPCLNPLNCVFYQKEFDDVGCKWSTGKITKDPNTYQIAQINSSKEEIIGFIWIGYGNEPPLINRPLISTIYRERD